RNRHDSAGGARRPGPTFLLRARRRLLVRVLLALHAGTAAPGGGVVPTADLSTAAGALAERHRGSVHGGEGRRTARRRGRVRPGGGSRGEDAPAGVRPRRE